MKTHFVRGFMLMVFLCALGISPVFAEQIQIHVTGLDFQYDGIDIFDGMAKAGGNYNTAEADPITTIDFFKNSVYVGSLTGIDHIFADLLIKDVQNIPKNGGMINTGNIVPGFGFDLLQNNGVQTTPLLSLNINQLTVSYSGLGIYAAIGGLADGIAAQNLPFGLVLDTQDQVSLLVSSANLTNVTNTGNFLSGFNAFGTSDINGTLKENNIPEPSTFISLAGFAICSLMAVMIRRRRQTA